MQSIGYLQLASFYDSLYSKKDYQAEANFLSVLLRQHDVRTLLDAGCGTGTHMALLEAKGFTCAGLDQSPDMLEVARTKVKGELFQADISGFETGHKYDAIICMFAVFNHLLGQEAAMKAIACFRRHLGNDGIVIIDLHNPQGGGSKVDRAEGIERKMNWSYDPASRTETTRITYTAGEETIEDTLTLRIYRPEEIGANLAGAGFRRIQVLEGYGFEAARPESRNLEIIATL